MKHNKKMVKVSVLLLFLAASGCASFKLGEPPGGFQPGLSQILQERDYSAENINGEFPQAVYIKTRTQTFNSYHYYIVSEGRIWYKSIDPEAEPREWRLLGRTGLPRKTALAPFTQPRKIAEISADADEITALSEDGAFYRYCFDPVLGRKSNTWYDRQGWPKAEALRLDGRTAANRAWALGKRNSHVLYYEDIFGNQHHNGAMEIATTYLLLADGQEISYADTGLPADFSRNFAGPERGAFIAEALSASASTMFLINEAGEMYTRLADFDTAGCDPMWFKYTYTPYRAELPGDNYFSNLNEWALPAEDWRRQPQVPLSGKAALSRHITILQNGQGNAARELRVAGFNETGEAGFWTKAIFADEWAFKTAPLQIHADALLHTAKDTRAEAARVEADPPVRGERGASPDKRLSGCKWIDGGTGAEADGWERDTVDAAYEIPDFNILEGSCRFNVLWNGEVCPMILHPVELWTYLKRGKPPGRSLNGESDVEPKLFLATLDIPDDALSGLSDEFSRLIAREYVPNDKKLFHYRVTATENYAVIRETGRNGPVLFLTDGSIPASYPDFLRTSHQFAQDDFRRYESPELTFGENYQFTVKDAEALDKKIRLNRDFRAELDGKIARLDENKRRAAILNRLYLQFHYTVKMSPLRFVDIPKLRTLTSYGREILLTNSEYINGAADTRSRVYRQIIELLDARIACYEDVRRLLAHGALSVPMPGNYSETLTGYRQIAGIPQSVSGHFQAAGYPPVAAVLRFVRTGTDADYLGWHIALSPVPPRHR